MVVIAIPAFILLFVRIHAYYERAGRALRIDETPSAPRAQAHHRHRPGQPDLAPDRARALRGRVARPGGASRSPSCCRAPTRPTQRRRDAAGPVAAVGSRGAARVLHTEYASVVEPIVAFIDESGRAHPDHQVVVLIPVIRPDRWRYRFLHNQIDLVLSSVLRARTDIVVARVSLPPERIRPRPTPRPCPPDPLRSRTRLAERPERRAHPRHLHHAVDAERLNRCDMASATAARRM